MTVVDGVVVVSDAGALPVWQPGDSLLAVLLSCVFPTRHEAPPLCVRCRGSRARVCPGPYTDAEKWTIAKAVARLPVRERTAHPQPPEAR